MPAVGSLRVELELDDGSFTTRVIRAGTTLEQLEKQIKPRTVEAMRQLDSGFSQAGQTLTRFTLVLGLAREALYNLHSVTTGFGLSILRTAGDIERLNVLLSNMSSAIDGVERAAEGRRASQFLLDLSRNAPFALRDLTESFVRLRAGGIENTTGAMQSLTDAVAAFGGSREQLGRAATAIQQMAGKGVISMEELRQQLGEAVPSALPLLARALGQTVDELVKNISDGKVRAQPALEALFAEFNRTFGGRAVAMMETFNGQVQQLQNVWQRLQTITAGAPGSGGFLDKTTDALKEFNAFLQSPDMLSFGIRVGQMLGNLVEGFVTVAKAAYEFRDAIVTVATALGGLLAFAVTRRIFAFLAAEAALVVLQLSLLVNGLRSATVAMGTFAVAANASAMSAMAAGITTFVTALAGVSRVIAGALIAPVATATAAWTGFVGLMSTVGNALAPAFSNLATRMATTTTAAGALAFTLRTLFTGTVIVGGIWLMIEAVSYLVRKYQELTQNAGAAYERIRQGATDESSLAALREENQAIQAALNTARENVRKIQELRATGRRNQTAVLEAANGVGVIANAQGGRVTTNNMPQLEQAYAENLRVIQEGERRLTEARTLERAAGARRIEQLAQIASQNEIAALQRSMLEVRAKYQQAEEDIARGREQISRAQRDNAISPEIASSQLQGLNEESFANKTRLYETQLAGIMAAITQAQTARDQAVARGHAQALADSLKLLEELRKQEEAVRGELQNLAREGENVLGAGGSGQAEKTRQAETAITNMRARIAELNDASLGLGGNLARINELIAAGRWGDQLPTEVIEKLRRYGAELDRAELKMKAFQEAQQGLSRIDTGLRRAEADLAAYTNAISNPNLPEAQRAFIRFEGEMREALLAVGLQTQFVGREYEEAARRVGIAVDAARQVANAQSVTDYIGQTDRYRARAANPGQARLTERLRQIREERDAMLSANLSVTDSAARMTRARQIEEGAAAREAEARADASRAGAGAARQEENAVTRLTARLAELRAEQVDGTGEYERQYAILDRQNKLTTDYGRQVLELARAIDTETTNREKATRAYRAYQDIQNQITENRTENNNLLRQLQNPNVSEDGKAFSNLQGRIARLRQQIEEAPGTDPAERARRLAAADEFYTQEVEKLALRRAMANRDAERQIRLGLADTNSERRRLLNQELDIEEAQARELLNRANVNAEKRRAIEDANTRYFAAAREQVLRQTEGATSKQFREWVNLADQMDNAFASAFSSMADALAKFVTTGKLDFKSLADTIISEIIRVQIRAAIGGIFGKSGFDFSSLISSFFGGSSGSSFIAGTMQGFGQHEGGITGLEATFRRLVPSHLFQGAPRFHTGIGPDEQAAILQKGEGVFTRGQMAAIGRMNHSYAMVEGVMGRMLEALDMPSAGRPTLSDGGGKAGGMPNVTINLTNETGQQMEAMSGTPRMDLDGMVIDVWLRAAGRPGPVRDMIKGGS